VGLGHKADARLTAIADARLLGYRISHFLTA
jgi:hypothetical protein